MSKFEVEDVNGLKMVKRVKDGGGGVGGEKVKARVNEGKKIEKEKRKRVNQLRFRSQTIKVRLIEYLEILDDSRCQWESNGNKPESFRTSPQEKAIILTLYLIEDQEETEDIGEGYGLGEMLYRTLNIRESIGEVLEND